ncbi:hypothetical protein BDN72DRAFT_161623 [Pluteus cervinus]|uniref:Uncharacterized protein n=1 Tax=Pluteus cervinus TaxID=181527 RepID=A0ACD3AKB3_9AGAR|nr:hypothetical protein BDN72DRAFT_161623 [Pluteus cervinus]
MGFGAVGGLGVLNVRIGVDTCVGVNIDGRKLHHIPYSLNFAAFEVNLHSTPISPPFPKSGSSGPSLTRPRWYHCPGYRWITSKDGRLPGGREVCICQPTAGDGEPATRREPIGEDVYMFDMVAIILSVCRSSASSHTGGRRFISLTYKF